MNTTKKTLGIDLGGTKILAAVVENGQILETHRVPTPQHNPEVLYDAMAEAAQTLLEKHPDIELVGLGSPGPLDLQHGKIIFAPNIANLENAPVVKEMQARLDKIVTLENDANAAGFAEHLYGAAHNWKSSVYITVSTGIGAGLYIGNKIIHGSHGSAGEMGHMTMLPYGPLGGDSHHGTLESIAAGRAMEREARYSYHDDDMDARELFQRAKDGEEKALKIIDNSARFVGIGMSNLQKVFDPEGFVIGGGISSQGEFYLSRVRESYEHYSKGYPQAYIELAKLGTDAGVIGAASVALYPDRGL